MPPCMTSRPFLSTPSVRRATDIRGLVQSAFGISIHALREEGDPPQSLQRGFLSPFLSTPSVRRATWRFFLPLPSRFISIHALREEGDPAVAVLARTVVVISIHALREEGDPLAFYGKPFPTYISIHALREEGDDILPCVGCAFRISIHALREEGDLVAQSFIAAGRQFLSTPSVRRATAAD